MTGKRKNAKQRGRNRKERTTKREKKAHTTKQVKTGRRNQVKKRSGNVPASTNSSSRLDTTSTTEPAMLIPAAWGKRQ